MPTPKAERQSTEPSNKSRTLNNELADIFPALKNYKSNHSLTEFKKLCIEIEEFIRQVYASTQSKEERQIYFAMLEKLNKP
jgi:hypothetical protein